MLTILTDADGGAPAFDGRFGAAPARRSSSATVWPESATFMGLPGWRICSANGEWLATTNEGASVTRQVSSSTPEPISLLTVRLTSWSASAGVSRAASCTFTSLEAAFAAVRFRRIVVLRPMLVSSSTWGAWWSLWSMSLHVSL